jgi:hypothetical protein
MTSSKKPRSDLGNFYWKTTSNQFTISKVKNVKDNEVEGGYLYNGGLLVDNFRVAPKINK